MRLFQYLTLMVSLSCLRVETNPLDASGPVGFLLSQALLNSQARSSFLLFTGTSKFLETKGDGVYTGRTFSGVAAGRIDAAAVLGRTIVGVNSADNTGYFSSDAGITWNTGSGISGAAGTRTVKNCGGILSAAGVNGTDLNTASSSDGVNWTQVSVAYLSPAVYGAGCHGSTFLLAFTSTSGPLTGQVGTSTDGRNYGVTAVGGTAVPMGLASDGATIMAVDSGGQYYTSTNSGGSYAGPSAVGQASPWKSIAYAGGRFIGTFFSAPNCNILTYNGTNWTGVQSFACAAAPTWGGVAVSGSTILVVGTTGTAALVYRSTDNGITWVSDSISEAGVTGFSDAVVLPP
jgi:hypothetical protein